MIVDESSESLECDLVAALPSTTLHLILIGECSAVMVRVGLSRSTNSASTPSTP